MKLKNKSNLNHRVSMVSLQLDMVQAIFLSLSEVLRNTSDKDNDKKDKQCNINIHSVIFFQDIRKDCATMESLCYIINMF